MKTVLKPTVRIVVGYDSGGPWFHLRVTTDGGKFNMPLPPGQVVVLAQAIASVASGQSTQEYVGCPDKDVSAVLWVTPASAGRVALRFEVGAVPFAMCSFTVVEDARALLRRVEGNAEAIYRPGTFELIRQATCFADE